MVDTYRSAAEIANTQLQQQQQAQQAEGQGQGQQPVSVSVSFEPGAGAGVSVSVSPSASAAVPAVPPPSYESLYGESIPSPGSQAVPGAVSEAEQQQEGAPAHAPQHGQPQLAAPPPAYQPGNAAAAPLRYSPVEEKEKKRGHAQAQAQDKDKEKDKARGTGLETQLPSALASKQTQAQAQADDANTNKLPAWRELVQRELDWLSVRAFALINSASQHGARAFLSDLPFQHLSPWACGQVFATVFADKPGLYLPPLIFSFASFCILSFCVSFSPHKQRHIMRIQQSYTRPSC